jgi:hypothetical protein
VITNVAAEKLDDGRLNAAVLVSGLRLPHDHSAHELGPPTVVGKLCVFLDGEPFVAWRRRVAHGRASVGRL